MTAPHAKIINDPRAEIVKASIKWVLYLWCLLGFALCLCVFVFCGVAWQNIFSVWGYTFYISHCIDLGVVV